jgi:hypothetical protein
MATAFETLTTKFEKWSEIIRNNFYTEPSKEKEKELCFDRRNMLKAVSSQWSHSMEDFTTANQCGMFRHSCCVQNATVNDRGENVTKRRAAICFHATIPGKKFPRKPRVANKVFKEEDEMDDRVRGQKKRRREDKVDKTISVSTHVSLAADFDFSCWSSGDAKKPFVPLAGELVPDCLARRIDLLRHCNSREAAWVDGVETHDKDGLCKPAAVFKIRQQCMLSCQACIFALTWMNQQCDCDFPK